MIRSVLSLTFLLFMAVTACRKKADPVIVIPGNPSGEGAGKLSLTFQNVAGGQPVIIDSAWYLTANNDSLKVTEFKYYISNIVLYSDTSQFKEWESYYLVDERINSSRFFTVDSIPKGIYKRISFIIGVDAPRNTKGAQTGALDPIHGMFWDWNSGYIMAKLEGFSPSIATPDKKLSYHIAGFEGHESVLRTVTINFPAPVEISSAKSPNIHFKADVLEWFKTPEVIKTADLPVIGVEGTDALKVSENYADMFTIDHID